MDNIRLIFRTTHKQINSHCRQFLCLMVAPLLVSYLLIFIATTFPTNNAFQYFCLFLYLLNYVFLALSVHRVIIVGPDSVPKWVQYTISKRAAYYTLYAVCLFILLMVISFVSLIPTVGGLLQLLFSVYVFARVLLVFPAISVDRYWSFYYSWLQTKQVQDMTLFVAVTMFLMFWLSNQISLSFGLLSIPLSNFIELVFFTYSVVLISVAFKFVCAQNE